ncbi:glycoside hydrolase family 28 protein [Mycena maculata]|uniref:Glycoside hydrolase family 28 protein n=1 Tax=Mycena maculata TaxID=230809 RepID=A0AAD7HEE8_9AGAR|nr:glycoside hydrolase family 28 protein [Mycena maculata]
MLPVLPLLLLATRVYGGHVVKHDTTCIVQPSGNFTDDSPAIVEAFTLCGQGGMIEFLNETYWIEKVMNTTGLNDVQIDLRGTLLWSAANISYWLENSLPLGYQNQSSAWFLGGNNITFNGHGYGTFNGNGQIWYDYTKGVSNLAGRPHALTIWETNNSTFTGIRFLQSQMWTMTLAYSSFVNMSDIFVSSLSNDSEPARNTDGADTLGSHHIIFRGWEVHNGDDSIAMKRNSSDILIENSSFYTGLGVAIGSIGQYLDEVEFVERVLTRNCSFIGTRYVGYIKTWTGVQQGFPPNGGGGGTGWVRDVAWTNSTLSQIVLQPAEITQCTTFSGAVGECDTSTLQISNITWSGLEGSITNSSIADLECSGAAPCQNLEILNSNFILGTNATAGTYSCHAVTSTEGFTCS